MPRREDYQLRPIMEKDLGQVLEWRNSARIRAYMYTDHIITMDEHRAWFERLQENSFSSFLIFEYRGFPVGIKSFSQIDKQNNKCYWGFYIGEPDLPRGSATLMGVMALEYIFGIHNFRKLCAEAFAFNQASISYHKRLGFVEEGHFVKHILKNGSYENVISFALFYDDWLRNKDNLEQLCSTDSEKKA